MLHCSKSSSSKYLVLSYSFIISYPQEILYMKGFDDRLGLILSFLIQEREGENIVLIRSYFWKTYFQDLLSSRPQIRLEMWPGRLSNWWTRLASGGILFPITCLQKYFYFRFSIHKLTSLAHLVQEKLDLESFKFCFTVASR